jgi:hypothetical protein
MFAEMRQRVELARETYNLAREDGQGRVSAGLAALRAAASKDRSSEQDAGDFKARLAGVLGRSKDQNDVQEPPKERYNYARERLKQIMERDAGQDGQAAVHKLDGHSEEGLADDRAGDRRKPSVSKRLDDVLNRPRERLEPDNDRSQQKDREAENEKENTIDRDGGDDFGL